MTTIEEDRKLLSELGGASKVADLMGFPKAGGPQRVQNWYARGIPAAIRVARPDLFMRGVIVFRPTTATTATTEAP